MSTSNSLTYRTLASYRRVELLHLVQESPGSTLAELVDATGIHINTVREHMQRLIDEGFVVAKSEHRTTRGRPRVLYSAATGADDTAAARERLTGAVQRAEALRRYAPEAVLGDDTVFADEALNQLDALDDHLDRAGFDPALDTTKLEVELSGCPYREMVDEHRDVVCSVHLGIIRTVLSHAGGPVSADRLLPFTTPGCCTLALSVDPTD
ncbi:winged helix-turn-helix transcriptional regulator [Agromyces atrinae]|uniref:Putative ArsR family transcriptional regulator n=1 Tax=Agromyces atrinae TaxID=592376 RepID=A0A4V1R1Z8_9MICO|nr:winged helix-turn-helix transcriptional regulator [Agromyces atrinae]MCI2957725.1 winged helix-turn-helix transcriptional regulator [Agromyces atrinae]NYD66966.1 putative ArsR family transcriptional regulator [Agromyces atrinae]RXZ85298.1 winged helix-turn-helix transcriptional regulator [Agromyces atrinae]RXZ85406.1 winged helix-turn-helix transcriptional regulator [Agromyces atrinae]